MSNPKKKKKAFIIIILSFWLLVIYLVYFFYYKWTVTQLKAYEDIEVQGTVLPDNPKLDSHQMLNIGWAHTDKDRPNSSYLNFPEKKDSGVVRVGFFGCSFMKGSEVSDSLNIVDLLNKKLKNINRKDIECINFGVGAYGLHQSYLLYQYVAKKYDLDVVVFNAYEWHADRDGTFRFGDFYPYIHSRYIVEDGNLKLLDVIGEEKKEAYRTYAEFFPPYQYLKYDAKCPNFLSPFFAARFNYFFYHKKNYDEMKKEILETYEYMAKSMISDGKKVIFLGNDKYIQSMLVKDGRFQIAEIYDKDIENKNHLYQAPLLHKSPIGNDFRANVLLAEFLGEYTKVPYLEFTQIISPSETYSREAVETSYFSFEDEGKYGTFISDGKTTDWKIQKYIRSYDTALVQLLLVGGTYAEPEFLSISSPETKAVLELGTKEGKQINVNIAISSTPYFSCITGMSAPSDFSAEIIKSKDIGLNGLSVKFKQNVVLEKADFKIAGQSYPVSFVKNAQGGYQFMLSSTLKMRSCNDEYFDVKSLKADTGVFYYNVISKSEKKIKIPVFAWKRSWIDVRDDATTRLFNQ